MSAGYAQDNSLRAALFSFKGRLSRARFWEYTVLTHIASAVLLFLISILFFQVAKAERGDGSFGAHAPLSAVIIVILYLAVFLWIGLALLWKRFHDRGRTGWFVLVSIVPIIGFLWIVVDAYCLPGKAEANRYGPVPNRSPRQGFAEAGFVGAGVGVLVILFALGRNFVMEPFKVPSGSNEPTITNGDFVAVSRYAYRLGEPARGDVVVFINPRTGEDYMKRVVGLPGDKVQLKGGIVSINGQPATRKRIEDYHERDWFQIYRRYDDTPRYRYVETLPGGGPHEILGASTNLPEDAMPQDNTQVFTVPPDHFFVLGDNRDNSNDSRFQGPVPLGNLVGRAEFMYFSRAPDTPVWRILLGYLAGARWERVLKVVH